MRIVNSLDELLRLPRDPRVNGLGARTRVQLEIPGLTRHALLHAQGSLNTLQARCGCFAGGLVTLGALIYGCSYVVRHQATLFSFGALRGLGITLLAAFFAGFIAKFLTLAITRWQFAWRCRAQHRALLRELHTHLSR